MTRGLVLAGGKSSRFGTDKSKALYQGVPFLERAVRLLQGLGLKPIVVGRPGMDTSCTVLSDKFPDQGPLGGLYTAMTVFKKTAFLTVTCDMPLISTEVLSFLLEKHGPHHAATFFASENNIQPFPGVYEPSILSALQESLMSGFLSVRRFLDQIPTPQKNPITWQGNERLFSNVNTPSDFESLIR